MTIWFFSFCFLCFLVFITVCFIFVLADSRQLKVFAFYSIVLFSFVFIYFCFHDIEIWGTVLKRIVKSGDKLIITGNGYNLLYLLIDFCAVIAFIVVMPIVLLFFYYFLINVWTKQENKQYNWLFLLNFYYFFLSFWILYQDLIFSSWDIFSLNENSLNKSQKDNLLSWNNLWLLLDYQPQLDLILLRIKVELFDFLLWQFCFFLFLTFVFLKIKDLFLYLNNNHFKIVLINIFLIYFFLGGDGLQLDLLVIFATWFFYEFLVFSFSFFGLLKKKK